MLKKSGLLLAFFLLSFSLFACSSQADIKGVILSVEADKILLSQNLTPNDYQMLKDKTASKLRNADLDGSGPYLNLIDLTYKKNHKFSEGDYVKVWLAGPVLESYPSQGQAKKIEIIK